MEDDCLILIRPIVEEMQEGKAKHFSKNRCRVL